jgi:hypothetical protein
MACTAVAPVPITATRLPVKSTPSWGQRAVWYCSPRKLSRPSKAGVLTADRQPTAVMRNFAVTHSPSSVLIAQRLVASS